MSDDNTIEYTIEESETERKVESMPTQKPTRQANGLSGIPQHVVNQLPPSFFESQPIEHGDAFREFMLQHEANMKIGKDDMSNIHPSEYFQKIIKKEKND
jgi:hypothetical protein